MHPQLSWIEQLPSKQQVNGSNPFGCTKTKKMEDVFEQQHYDFINSEDYFQFMKEFFEYEEKEALYSEINEL